ncbi:PTS sugar transporter subunit IIB [Erysipelothrix larvae]|uniref:Ascorbate-specific PTS system EIIA component n=1 Tax=Erysipelothrix larvae TaxID=1514105 RepID=A0A109UHM1_9FIRM|nr:PTS sugar transporter subunit IIA [Erysipelothrix larvae]AMC94348.1 PTS sugar transporter subunit IIB [Erysipelothrix larvae]
MLGILVNEAMIQFDVVADDWIDAVRKSAKPLLEAGKITEGYIQAIIDSAIEAGPYFVIAPHVALPHARPEMGVKENAIGITTLKNPVEFGNASNDPVKYVFTLSAVDNSKHLDALATLAELLDDEAFFNVLDTASKPHEVIDYINKLRKD